MYSGQLPFNLLKLNKFPNVFFILLPANFLFSLSIAEFNSTLILKHSETLNFLSRSFRIRQLVFLQKSGKRKIHKQNPWGSSLLFFQKFNLSSVYWACRLQKVLLKRLFVHILDSCINDGFKLFTVVMGSYHSSLPAFRIHRRWLSGIALSSCQRGFSNKIAIILKFINRLNKIWTNITRK